ncbi:hypothetical protein ACFW2E_04245, partial [Streptomyces sp. NPDC058964]
MSDSATGGCSADFGPEALGPALSRFVRQTGAYVCAVYLMPRDGQVLQLAVLSGVSWRIASPWTRGALAGSTPAPHDRSPRPMVWVKTHPEKGPPDPPHAREPPP